MQARFKRAHRDTIEDYRSTAFGHTRHRYCRVGEGTAVARSLVSAATDSDQAQLLGEALKSVRMEDSACVALEDAVHAAEDGLAHRNNAEAALSLTSAAGVLQRT